MSADAEFDDDRRRGPTGHAVVVCGRDGLTSTRWFDTVAEAESALDISCDHVACMKMHTLIFRDDETGRWRVRSLRKARAHHLPPGHAQAESAPPRPTPREIPAVPPAATTADAVPANALLTAPTSAPRVCFRGHDLPDVRTRGERCSECQCGDRRNKRGKGI
jgi:hypothetical protein